jgi:hypothetical protein
MDYLNNKTIFIYVCIFISVIFIFSLKTITLNIFYGTIIAGAIIYYLRDKLSKYTEHANNIISTKTLEISDGADTNILNKSELINFLFSIKDLYYYNPSAYSEMIDALNNFTETYKIIQEDKTTAGVYFDHAVTYKNNSLNALHSLILSIDNRDIIKKINTATHILEEILLVYINDIHHTNAENIQENGYTNQTTVINVGPHPINSYSLDSNKDNIIDKYTYDIF